MPQKLRPGIQTGFSHEVLRKWGCYFFCLLRWAEEVSDFRAGKDQNIISLFDNFAARGWLTNQCKVLQPAMILNHLAGANIFNMATHEALRPADYIAVERVNHGAWPHFMLHIGTKIWDSWANPGKYAPPSTGEESSSREAEGRLARGSRGKTSLLPVFP